MTSKPSPGSLLIDQAIAAVDDAQARSHPYRGWEALQARDADGNVIGLLPYTESALKDFEAAHRWNPEDVGVAHHLAIAHHAQAWDLELSGDSRAALAWKSALKYWRVVQNSSEFWVALEAKLGTCSPGADLGPIREARANLMEQLLAVHVEFIRHYCELGEAQRGNFHIAIIQEAQISPAVKKRLTQGVFAAMTASVAEAKTSGHHDSALVSIERFLALFSDYLPALRMHVEVTHAWLSTLSWQHEWESIQQLHHRASAPAAALAGHQALESDPLAWPALEELTFEFILRGFERGWSRFQDGESGGAIRRDEAKAALEVVHHWGRQAAPRLPAGSQALDALVGSLVVHGELLRQEAHESCRNVTDPRRGLTAARTLLEKAVQEVDEAGRFAGVNSDHLEQIDGLRSVVQGELASVQAQITRLDMGWIR